MYLAIPWNTTYMSLLLVTPRAKTHLLKDVFSLKELQASVDWLNVAKLDFFSPPGANSAKLSWIQTPSYACWSLTTTWSRKRAERSNSSRGILAIKFHGWNVGLLCWMAGNKTTQPSATWDVLFFASKWSPNAFHCPCSLECLQWSCSYGLVVTPFPSLGALHQIFNG